MRLQPLQACPNACAANARAALVKGRPAARRAWPAASRRRGAPVVTQAKRELRRRCAASTDAAHAHSALEVFRTQHHRFAYTAEAINMARKTIDVLMVGAGEYTAG